MSVAPPLNKLPVLRKKLDLMGYHEPLPLEAVPLVAQLFSDFLQLTENFNNLKAEHTQLLKLKENFEDNVEPYKEENAKLIKENNELHQEIMKMKGDNENIFLNLKVKVKKMEDENASLRFLNNQYIQKVHKFEKLSEEKSGGRRSRSSFHQQHVEVSHTVPPSVELLNQKIKIKDGDIDPQIADMFQLSADTITKLQEENKDLLEAIEQAHNAMKSLEGKVNLRDSEIQRLTVQLNQGRPLQTIRLETKERKKADIIENLQHQLEGLYYQNEELEKIIIKYCGKEYLPEKLRPSGIYSFMDTGYSTVNLDNLRKLEKHLTADQVTLQHEGGPSCEKHIQKISRLENLLKSANLEKRKLGDKITSLLASEKGLKSEISKLKRKVSPHGASPPRYAERLARLVQVLEAQRDFFKEEYETLKRLQEANTKVYYKGQKKSSSDTKISEIRGQEASQITRERSFLHLVEEERDFYKEKYYSLLEKQDSSKGEKVVVDLSIATADKEVMATDDTLEKLRKENFQLLQRIKALEHQIHQNISSAPEVPEPEKQRIEKENLEKAVAQLQNNIEEFQGKVEKISKEKEFFMRKYQQAVIENSRLREATSTKADSVLTDGLNLSKLQGSEDQMPTIYTDTDVQEKIKEIEEQHKCKDTILRQQIEQLQKLVSDLKNENELCKSSLVSHKTRVASLEHQVASLQYQLSQAVNESDQHRTAAEHIRLIADQGGQSSEQLQLFLTNKQEELNVAEQKIKTLENNIEELKDILKHREREITDLRSTTANLEEDKEKQHEAVSEKDLHLSSLQQQMYSKELHASEMRITVSALEAELEKVQSEVRLKDKEISCLKQQLDSKTQDSEETLHSLDILRKENSRLLEDLSSLTKENQLVTQELENKLQELDVLRRKVAEYVTEVSRIQEVLFIKDHQRSELIQQYQELSNENTHLETETRRLQSEAAAVQVQVQAKDIELQDLRSTIQSLEQEIEEYLSAQETHRLELTFLNSSVSGLEAELQLRQQEIERLQAELTGARSLSVQMDASREQLQKMLADEGSTNAKLTSELEDLRDEVRALRAQLSSERTSLMNMEGLMSTQREKEFRSHLANQELSAEVSLLRNRLHESVEKMEALTKELSTFKTKVAEMEMEKERLKRQITDEKYERERDRNELLRLQHLQQLYVSESSEKIAQSHSKFTLPRFSSLPSQKAVPAAVSSGTQNISGEQYMAMSASSRRACSGFAAERSVSQPSLPAAATVSTDTSEAHRIDYTKVATEQALLTSRKTRSSAEMVSSEGYERKSPNDRVHQISRQSSSKDSSSDSS